MSLVKKSPTPLSAAAPEATDSPSRTIPDLLRSQSNAILHLGLLSVCSQLGRSPCTQRDQPPHVSSAVKWETSTWLRTILIRSALRREKRSVGPT